jgi:hypothetical protein
MFELSHWNLPSVCSQAASREASVLNLEMTIQFGPLPGSN